MPATRKSDCPGALFPDYYETWTAEEAEHELSGFVFRGPGWYIHDDDSVLLVAPLNRHTNGRELFRFCVWGVGFVEILNWLKSAPVHFVEQSGKRASA